jgi:hypothetical protein
MPAASHSARNVGGEASGRSTVLSSTRTVPPGGTPIGVPATSVACVESAVSVPLWAHVAPAIEAMAPEAAEPNAIVPKSRSLARRVR